MKAKTFKTIIVMVAVMLSSIAAVKTVRSNVSFLRVEFLQHGKGYTQHFINSFIN